jgi:hypothetical protein
MTKEDELLVRNFLTMFYLISYNESTNIMLVVCVYDVVDDEDELE